MRIVLQRVKKAVVTVQNRKIASIEKGILLLVGIGKRDTFRIIEKTAQKILTLRIFEDDNGKMNLNIQQAAGGVLSVPQFTLLANTEKGNRPGFDNAARPDKAEVLWKKFNSVLKEMGTPVFEGKFGARMEVSIVNDGPATFIIDSKM